MAVQEMDALVLLQHGDELIRAQYPKLGIDPARQSLEAAQPPGDRADHGLIIGLDTAVLKRRIEAGAYKLFQTLFQGMLLSKAWLSG